MIFFFQAEDGIRDLYVTGVQTCALPILFEKVGGGRTPIINISGGTEVGAVFLTCCVAEPIKACSLGGPATGDRKSTRLNSSHVEISYAVFCLKKKKKKQHDHTTSEHSVI